MAYIPRNNSNYIGLLVYSNVFDILNVQSNVAQFGSTKDTANMRFFINGDEEQAFGLQVIGSNGADPYLNFGYWDSAAQAYRTQMTLHPEDGIELCNVSRFNQDVYITGNLGVGTTQALPRVYIAQYHMDISGDVYSTGTMYTSNLVVYGSNTILETITCNTQQMTITNAGTGPALVVCQQGRGLDYAIAEFRDLDESNVAMIIADGGYVGIGTRIPTAWLDVVGDVRMRETLQLTSNFTVETGDIAVVSGSIGIGTNAIQEGIGLNIAQGNVLIASNLGIGIGTTQINESHALEVAGGDVVLASGTRLGIGTDSPKTILDVAAGVAHFAGSIGIGTTAPRPEAALEIQTGSVYINTGSLLLPNSTAFIGIGTNTIQEGIGLNVAQGNVLIASNLGIGIGTTQINESHALEVAGGDVVLASGTRLGIGTDSPKTLLDVAAGVAHFAGSIGIGTTVPIVGASLQIAEGALMVAGNVGIGLTALPTTDAALEIGNGNLILLNGNLGVGTTTPTHALHLQAETPLRINQHRYHHYIPLSAGTRIIQFYRFQYTSVPEFSVRVFGTLYTAYSSQTIDVVFGGRFGYGITQQHASTKGILRDVAGADVGATAIQLKFFQSNAGSPNPPNANIYEGYLVLNEGTAETLGADISFELYGGEDAFLWNPTATQPISATLAWNALVSPNVSYTTQRTVFRDTVGIGTTQPRAVLHAIPSTTALAAAPALIYGKATTTSLTNQQTYMQIDSDSGATVFKLSAAGNVGIGTGTPATALDIQGVAVVSQGIGIGTTQLSSGAALEIATGAVYLADASTAAIGIGTTQLSPGAALDIVSGAILLRDGNLGIGTVFPKSALDVVGSGEITGTLGIGTAAPDNGVNGVRLALADGVLAYQNTSGDKIYFTSQATDGAMVSVLNTGGLHYSAPSHRFSSNGSPFLDIVENGNIGIGTTAPRSTVDIVGDVRISQSLYTNDIRIESNVFVAHYLGIGTTVAREGTALEIADNAGSVLLGANVGVGIGTTLILPGASLDVRGTAVVSANMGIGTAAPRSALDVVGTALISGGGIGIGVGATELTAGTAFLVADNAGNVYLGSNVGVGIGTTLILPGVSLDVRGTAIVSGNMGIGLGTTAPRSALDIVGTALISGNVGIGTTQLHDGIVLEIINSNGTPGAILAGYLGIGTTVVREGTALDLSQTSGAVLLNPNVGIGTYARPGAALEITGGSLLTTGNLGIGMLSGIETGLPRAALDIAAGSAIVATGSLGIGTTVPVNGLPLAIYDTTAVLIPKGSTDDRATIPAELQQTGLIRYNTTLQKYEGLGQSNLWNALGGIQDTAGSTYIAAEFTPGSGDGNLRFININIETMRIQPTGNVGIGNASPATRLTVNTPANYAGDTLRIASKAEPNDYYLNWTARNPQLFLMTHHLTLANQGTVIDNVMTIDQGGNIGIGTGRSRARLDVAEGHLVVPEGRVGIRTTAPNTTFALDVADGSARVSPTLYLNDTTKALTVQSGNIRLENTETNKGVVVALGATPSEVLHIQSGATELYRSSFLITDSTDTTMFYVGLNANVGIGTGAPRGALDVAHGGALFEPNVGIGTTLPRGILDISAEGRVVVPRAAVGLGTTVPRTGAVLDIHGGFLLLSGGSIGVGTDQPRSGAGLDVASRAFIEERLRVGAGGGAGTLFDRPDTVLEVSGKTHTTTLSLGTADASWANPEGYQLILPINAKIGSTDASRAYLETQSDGSNLHLFGQQILLDAPVSLALNTPALGIGTTVPRPGTVLDVAGSGVSFFEGNVGIGTVVPRGGAVLDVATVAPVWIAGSLGIGTAATGGVSAAGLEIFTPDLLLHKGNLGIGTGNPRATLDVATPNATVFFAEANIGIGTTLLSAGSRLHVNGPIHLQEGSLQFLSTNPGSMVEKYIGVGDRYGLGQYAPNILRVYVSDTAATSSFRVSRAKTDGSFLEMLTVNAAGNVGIGTNYTTPLERLDVAGSIRVSQDQGFLSSKDALRGMALPSGIVRRKFRHSKATYPTSSAEFRSYFASGMTFLEAIVVADINQPNADLDDMYAYEFLGCIEAPTTGLYEFRLDSDEATEVFVDGKRVAHYYGQHTMMNAGEDGTAYLTEGLHDIVVRFQEVSGNDGIVLSWKSPGDSVFDIIPSSRYHHRPADLFYSAAAMGRYDIIVHPANVGIGTVEPRGVLDVKGSQVILETNRLGVGTTAPRGVLDVVAAAGHVEPNVVFQGVQVGIGTVSPRVALDVRGRGIIAESSGAYDSELLSAAGGRGWALVGDDHQATLRLFHGSSATLGGPAVEFVRENAGTSAWRIDTRPAAGAPGTAAGSVWTLADMTGALGGSNDLPRMVVMPDGNVGIGTVMAAAKLHVYDGAALIHTRLGIGTTQLPDAGAPSTPLSLMVFGTDGLLLPSGTSGERPATPMAGTVRYNNENQQFEGYGPGSSWGSLGGVKSTDQLTYITAESSPGANDSNLRFYTGGVLRATINPDGNLGIGTETPRAILDVAQGGSLFAPNVGIGTIVPRGALDVADGAGVILFGGNVGIGTTLPRGTLDIVGGTTLIHTGLVGIGTNSPYLTTGVEIQAPTLALTAVGGGSGFALGIGTTAPRLSPGLDVHIPTVSFAAGTNVGIGTTAPKSALEVLAPSRLMETVVLVEDTTNTLGTVGRRGAAGVAPEEVVLGWVPDTFAGFHSKHHASSPGEIQLTYGGLAAPATGGGAFHLRQTNGATSVSRLTVDAYGNVGIGTTSPSITGLDLYGSLRSTALSASAAVVSDGNKALISSATSATQIGYLSTLTGNVQDQLNTKISQEGGSISSNLYVNGILFTSNLKVLGEYTIIDTQTSNTQQFTITNDGTGPALVVIQTGEQPVAAFYDHETGVSMIVDNNGHVGIGTATPLGHLHVEGYQSLFTNTNVGIGTTIARVALDVAGGDIYLAGNVGVGTLPTGSYRMFLQDPSVGAGAVPFVIQNTTGSVGIGTTLPYDRLHVCGKAVVSNGLTGAPANGFTGSDGVRLVLAAGTVGTPPTAIGVETGGILWNDVPAGGLYKWYVGSNEEMRLNTSGALGIGTTAPASGLRLDVGGSAAANRLYLGAPASRALGVNLFDLQMPIGGTIGSLISSNATWLEFQNDFVVNAAADIRLKTSGGEKLTVVNNAKGGGVGIGTTLPAAAAGLHVFGGDFLLTNGNLGIGTTMPVGGLHLEKKDLWLGNGASGGYKLIMTQSANTQFIQVNPSDQAMEFQTDPGAAGFRFRSTNAHFMTMAGSTGYVGIGTTTPKALLDVAGIGYFRGAIGIGTVARAGIGLDVVQSVAVFETTQVGIGTTAPRSALDVHGDKLLISTQVGIGTEFPRVPLDVEIATTRFGGNVGIGTVLPLATLDVRGGSVFLGNVGVGTTTPRAAIDFAVPSLIMTGAVGIGTTLPNETMKFRVYGDGFLGGNLGIGTTVPRATLDIAGGGGGIGGGALVIPEGSVGIGTYSPMVPVDLAVATVRIAGNLGIGTTSPRGLLDVAGVGSVFLPQANIGIGTTFGPALPLEVWSPKAMLIPVGANADRPAAALKGYLRYNTTTDQFEGFGAGNQWGSLGGVRDVAGETYIAAEESAGAADNNLRFITSNVERMRINRNGNVGIGTNLPSALLHLYDREADRLTVLLNWNSPSGTRFASLDTPTNSFLDPVLFNTNQSWAFQTNGLTRASIGDIGLTVSSNATLLLPNAAAATPAMAFTASTTTGVFSPATHTLAISTQGTERLRVAGNGNVGIGTTVPNYPLDIVGNVNYSGGLYRNGVLIPPNVWSLSPNANTGPNQYYSAGNIGIGTSSPLYPLHVMGSIYTSQGVISTSDKRMKTDLVVIPEPLEKIKALRGYTYQWNNAGSGGGGAAAQELSQLKRETGLIAQELEGVFPEAVYEDPNGMKAINYGHLAGLFVESLRAIVERLERLERCAGAAPPLHSSS